MRWVTQRGLVFGLHIHVGVDSPQKAIACANGLRTVLAELLALFANSPFWQGHPTGLASSRAKVFEGFPRSGLIDLERDTERPAPEAIHALIDRCRPAAKRCGCEPALDGIERLLALGGGADEQLRVYEETGDVQAVAAWVAGETARGLR